jgi:tetratricopeptide (TPR) repeat protein
MSIFEAMERLAGAALLALAPAVQVAVPQQQRNRGAELVRFLRQRGAGDIVDGYVGELTREIWVGAETRSLPQEALETHFRNLATVVAEHTPSEESLAGLLTPAAGADRARGIAVDLFLQSRETGALAKHELSDDVALFVLERSFARLLRDTSRISGLSSLLLEFVTGAPPDSRAVTGAVEPAAKTTAPAAESPAQRDERAHREAAELKRIREKYEISEIAQSRILALLESQGLVGNARLARYEQLAAWLLDARGQLMRPTNDDGDLRKLKARAAEALAAGDLTQAMETLKHVRRALRDGRRRIEARLEDEVAALKAQMTEEARAAARLAELATARRDYLTAADLYFEAADCLPKSARDEAWRYHLARADALYRKAIEDNDDVALGEALAGFGGVLKMLSDGANPRGAAQANLGLGRALHRQAEAGSGTGRLGDAIVAFRKAIGLISLEQEPALWSEAHGALARSLALSGQRGRQAETLREAIDAYRIAITSAPSELPASTMIELRLGSAATLLELAEFDKAPAVLEEAVSTYEEVLAQLPRSEHPELWANASCNLGSALLSLAEANRDAPRLKAAVAALSGALEVLTPEHDLETWTTASMTLADALVALAEADTSGADRLRAAIATYQKVLEVVDRKATPIVWATASMNLGSTLIRLGEHEDKRNNWLAAAGAMVPALEVFEAEGASAHADLARRTLKRFHEEWVGMLAPPAPGPKAPAPTSHLSKVG